MISALHGEIPCGVFLYPKSSDDFCPGILQNPAVRVNFMKKSPKIGQSV